MTLEMRGRRMRGQQVHRPGGKKGLRMFEEEQGGRRDCSVGTTGREEGHRSSKALQATIRNVGCIRALSPFSRSEHQHSEMLSTLPKVTQLVVAKLRFHHAI